MFNLVLTLLLILPFCLKCLDYRDDVLHKKDFINVNTAISTIPYIIDHASPDFVKAYGPLYDQKRTENCLRGHNILLFGDSLTEELVFDLAILLSGVSKNKNELDAFIEQGTGTKNCDHDYEHSVIEIPHSNIQMHFYHGRRNVTILNTDLNIRIRHRFTGHVSLIGNKLGINTFFQPEFQTELDCLLGFSDNLDLCPKPDTIIMNSGLHDAHENISDGMYFEKHVKKFMSTLLKRYDSNKLKPPRIIWKGNQEASMEDFNIIARKVVEGLGLTFINIADVYKYVPRYYDENEKRVHYTSDGTHFGSIARKHDPGNFGTVSMLITQMVLHESCPVLAEAGHSNSS